MYKYNGAVEAGRCSAVDGRLDECIDGPTRVMHHEWFYASNLESFDQTGSTTGMQYHQDRRTDDDSTAVRTKSQHIYYYYYDSASGMCLPSARDR